MSKEKSDLKWNYRIIKSTTKAFEDIPQIFRDYITAKACRIASNRMVSDEGANQILQQDEIIARANAIQYDTAQADYNVFNDGRNRQSYTSFRPFNALQR